MILCPNFFFFFFAHQVVTRHQLPNISRHERLLWEIIRSIRHPYTGCTRISSAITALRVLLNEFGYLLPNVQINVPKSRQKTSEYDFYTGNALWRDQTALVLLNES